MNTINEIPLDFGEREGFSGNLFPSEPNPTEFSSPFENSPFGEFWQIKLPEWSKPQFGKSKLLYKSNITIADNSKKISHNKTDAYQDLFSNNLSNYKFYVFADPNGEKVLEAYNNSLNSPLEKNEVDIFIETDDGTFDFAKIVRARLGSQVMQDLKFQFSDFENGFTSTEDIAEEFLKRAYNTSVSSQTRTEVDEAKLTPDFKDLLIKAIAYEYDNKKFDDFSWLLLILEGADYVGLNEQKFYRNIAHWLRSKKLTEEKYWNGDLPEKEYSPPLYPDFLFQGKEEDRIQSLSETFLKPITDLQNEVAEFISLDDPISISLKNNIINNLESIKKEAQKFINFLAKIHIPEGYFQTILKHYIAFQVGFYNGILELLASICDLIGIFLLILKNELGFKMTDQLFEKFENFVNSAWNETDKLIISILKGYAKILSDFGHWYATYKGKSYLIVKELGELLPDILTFLIPLLKGAKAAKLAKAANAEKILGKEAVEGVTEASSKKTITEAEEQAAKAITLEEQKIIAATAKEKITNGEAGQAIKKITQETEDKIVEKTSATKELDEIVIKKKKRKIVDSKGLRGSKLLTDLEKEEILKYAKPYYNENADELIQFADEFSTNDTGYMAMFDVLYINTDIMPGVLKTANSRLSWRAAMAHELEGHRFAAISNKTFFDKELSASANDLLEEMQASVRASKHGKDLSAIERQDLLDDALERYQKYSDVLIESKYENYTFNQILDILWTSKN